MANKNEYTQHYMSDEFFTKFVVPVFGKYECVKSNPKKSIFDSCREVQICETILGTGTLVGNLLITAAHIFNGYFEPSFKFENELYPLCKENQIIQIDAPKGQGVEVYNDSDCGDIAIFRMTSIFSPIELAESLPKQGQVLNNRFYCSIYKDGIDTIGIMSDDEGIAGNFFTCEMKPQHPTKGGSSGSPLFLGNILYGILHGGKDDYCVFYSTIKASINVLIEQNS